MPYYDFGCADCKAVHEVRVDYETKKNLELVCLHCGGIMQALPIQTFTIITKKAAKRQRPTPTNAKSCGHMHQCRCAINLTQPNPFQKEIDTMLDESKQE